jgi:hypothetical protein
MYGSQNQLFFPPIFFFGGGVNFTKNITLAPGEHQHPSQEPPRKEQISRAHGRSLQAGRQRNAHAPAAGGCWRLPGPPGSSRRRQLGLKTCCQGWTRQARPTRTGSSFEGPAAKRSFEITTSRLSPTKTFAATCLGWFLNQFQAENFGSSCLYLRKFQTWFEN